MEPSRIQSRISKLIRSIQGGIDRFSFFFILIILAVVDTFILVIPVDGVLISSSYLRPRRWLRFSFAVALGATIGAILLGFLVQFMGLSGLFRIFPEFESAGSWDWMVAFLSASGLSFVFLFAISPLPLQPAVIAAVLMGIQPERMIFVIFAGRLLKSLLIGFVASHAPYWINRLWGLGHEMTSVGLKIAASSSHEEPKEEKKKDTHPR